MKCPSCGGPVEKYTLDGYYCPACDHDWGLHAFKNHRRGKDK